MATAPGSHLTWHPGVYFWLITKLLFKILFLLYIGFENESVRDDTSYRRIVNVTAIL